MDFLDIRTVLFSQLLTHLVCTVVVWLLWRNNRERYRGLEFWVATFVLQLAGMVLIMLRGQIPDLLSMVVANVLALGGVALLYSGLASFAGFPSLDRLNIAALALFAAIHYYFSILDPDFPARNINFNVFLVFYSLRIIVLLRSYPSGLRRLGRAAAHTFSAFILVSLARIISALFWRHSHDFFDPCPTDTALFLLYSGLVILLTYSLFLIVNRRLMAETRDDYEGRIEAEKVLSGALRVAKLGTWRWDIKTNLLSWSDEMYSIFGIDKTGFGGNLADVLASAIHPDDKAAVEASNRQVIEANKPAPLEYRVLWPDGSLHWVHAEASELVKDETGKPAVLKGYAQDITARKNGEACLRDTAERLGLALRSARMGTWYLDIKENRRHFDEQVCRLLGLDHASFTGRAEEFFSALHPADRSRVKSALARVVETGGQYSMEYRAVWPDGSTHHLAARGLLRRDSMGAPERIDGIIWDITEMKRAEEAMRVAQKLESLGTLAGGIAHDFNNILTGIAGNISLIRKISAEGGDLKELMEEADSACLAAKGLARQLLTFASGGEPVKFPLDLSKLVREAVSFSLHGSPVKPELKLPDGSFTVMGDRDQLFQVVQNLALNAAQSMPGGGAIQVSLDLASHAAVEAVHLPPGRYAEFSVRDSGGGIPEPVMARLFEPYFSTKGSGRGLGLAVARSIIVKHDGHICASSASGAGSVFTVYLPLTDKAAQPAAGATAGKQLKSGGRVLILDDEEVVYKALRRMLAALGFEAEVAVRGEDALKAWGDARAAGRPFAAAIMDLTIAGGMGGAEAVKRLKQIDPAAKVIVSSGYAEDPIMAEYSTHGFDGVLSKPYRVEDLAAALSKLLD
ncbi:MAG: PAS domain-containing protein [Elusimicrobiales bacterium]|nr:PAS domain-containing protein [Elusimicrobiales bacterium]